MSNPTMLSNQQPLPFAKRLSCGVVILNDQAELLLCHVTGQDHWDLPKGGIDAGETPLAAALRETEEETGLRLPGQALLDLGCLPYRLRKDLHLFAALLPRIDPATLRCESRFSDADGERLPEMDGYAWFAFAQVGQRCSRKLAAVLLDRLNLDEVLRRLLVARAAQAAPLANVA
jgi:8-oxo-dGTP pyrophosphatase MutT (NUDIX family)